MTAAMCGKMWKWNTAVLSTLAHLALKVELKRWAWLSTQGTKLALIPAQKPLQRLKRSRDVLWQLGNPSRWLNSVIKKWKLSVYLFKIVILQSFEWHLFTNKNSHLRRMCLKSGSIYLPRGPALTQHWKGKTDSSDSESCLTCLQSTSMSAT